jgi:hypothetical protein
MLRTRALIIQAVGMVMADIERRVASAAKRYADSRSKRFEQNAEEKSAYRKS